MGLAWKQSNEYLFRKKMSKNIQSDAGYYNCQTTKRFFQTIYCSGLENAITNISFSD
jgi:hypothetical protein